MDNQLSKRLSLLYFCFIGVVIFLLISPLLILFGLLGKKYHPSYKIYSQILSKAINIYIRLSPVKWKTRDLRIFNEIADERFLIISNHRSHLDMFLYLSIIFKLRAVANQAIFNVPILGQVMKLSKNFALEKGKTDKFFKVQDDIREAIKLKDRVLVFPEMTRCAADFQGIQKFRLFIFQLAREEDVKILPIVLADTDKVWPKGKAEMDFSGHISLRALSPIEPNRFASSSELSKHIHKVMESSYMELTS